MDQSATGPDPGDFVMPLLAETLLALVIAYLVGVGVAWLVFGRAKKDSYL